jgi:cytochrome P450
MPVDNSSIPKPGTARDVAESILRWSAMISAAVTKPMKYFLRPRKVAKNIDSDVEQAGVDPNATEDAVTDSRAEKSFTVPTTADATVDLVDPGALDPEEIQRRRNLVRMLFNDFWSGAYEKPAAFAERLDQAEDYLNDCLAANGEIWRLDGKTRPMLGLPPRSSATDDGKIHAVQG